MINIIENMTTIEELASAYSLGESMLDFNYTEGEEIISAVERQVSRLGLETEFNSAMGW